MPGCGGEVLVMIHIPAWLFFGAIVLVLVAGRHVASWIAFLCVALGLFLATTVFGHGVTSAVTGFFH
jgi:hypothetical protein